MENDEKLYTIEELIAWLENPAQHWTGNRPLRYAKGAREQLASIKEDLSKCTKTLDEVITLFKLFNQDYGVIDDALKCIAAMRKRDPEFPISVVLAGYMHERGLLDAPVGDGGVNEER